MTLAVRSAARALLRSKTQAIVTEEAVSAFVDALEGEADRIATRMAAAVEREGESRRLSGINHLPRMTKHHAKVITIEQPRASRGQKHRAQEVQDTNGAGIEA